LAGGGAPIKTQKALLFLKKKKQKDFYESGTREPETPGSSSAEVFLCRFF
jgi:hypothetical protein